MAVSTIGSVTGSDIGGASGSAAITVPADNLFQATTQTQAEAQRDAYFASNPAELKEG